MPSRYYANGQAKTLVGGITNTAVSIVVSNVTGLPTSFPYTLVIDRGTALEDVMDVTAAVGTTLTVTRSVDGFTGQAHSNGARVEHVTTARDYTEFQTKLDDRVNLTAGQTIAGLKNFSTGIQINGNAGLITIPFHLGGQVPVAIAAPRFICPRPMTITHGYYRLGGGTMTFAIYKNGSNVATSASISTGGAIYDPADIVCAAGDYIQIGATAADASAVEFSLTLLATPT